MIYKKLMRRKLMFSIVISVAGLLIGLGVIHVVLSSNQKTPIISDSFMENVLHV